MKLMMTMLMLALSVKAFAYPSGSFGEEKIIGTDDLIAVNADGSNIPQQYRRLIGAFGIISMGCTATHIGNGYVLTAGHCFQAPEDLVRNQPCSGTTIQWGVREGHASDLTSTCQTIVAEQLNDTNDFAIIKVSPVPSVTVGVDIQRRAQDGDSLTIFSHPEMLPLRWSQSCVVEAVKHPGLPAASLQHKCDTNPGSSGATILNLQSLKVIGIHDGGLTSNGGMNYGTYIINSPIPDILKEIGF